MWQWTSDLEWALSARGMNQKDLDGATLTLQSLEKNRTAEVIEYERSLLEHEEALKAFDTAIQILTSAPWTWGTPELSVDLGLVQKINPKIALNNLKQKSAKVLLKKWKQSPNEDYDTKFEEFANLDVWAAYSGNSVSSVEGTLNELKSNLMASKTELLNTEESNKKTFEETQWNLREQIKTLTEFESSLTTRATNLRTTIDENNKSLTDTMWLIQTTNWTLIEITASCDE